MIDWDLNVESANAVLSGTLCVPSDCGAFPCVLMLPGSGSIDRDENMEGQCLNIYNSIAHCLAEAGFASFRYDKRGCGRSTGTYFQTGYFDFVDDAIAIFDCLKRDQRCEPNLIFAMGHSEGAVTAMHLHLKRREVAGIIQLCPVAGDIESMLLRQAVHVQDVMGEALSGDHVASQKALIERVKAQVALPQETESLHIGLKWFRELLSLDVREIYPQVDCPMLIIAGEKDVQCDPADVPALREITSADTEIHVVSNLTHLLRCDLEKPSILRYPELMPLPVEPSILGLMSSWLLSQVKSRTMTELPPADPLSESSYPEHCVDCETHLSAADLGRSWYYCEYCREAVCPTCEVKHACEFFRSNKIKKLV